MERGASGNVDVTIRIDKAQAQRIEEIVQALQKLGLDHIERHLRFMIVNGRVRADLLDALRRVEGVASVREDQIYKAQ
ncbi:hypothetical protein [Methylocystis sp. ATCC 49242]|uniref:hypothetical protein n=1 Tax=Methylocystis sp. ATCC 49242 TaxID=622637 RepID=UPI0001F8840B|nr:hypothetical protein [Methylocystis sp. ATCC 49242]